MNDFARFYALLKQMPHADKELLVETYSEGRTTSLREFLKENPKGFWDMLQAMQLIVDNSTGRSKVKEHYDNVDEKRRLRSLILRALQDQGVAVKNGNWSTVNDFVTKHAGAGKRLSTMTLAELKKFNMQVHKILEWHLKKQDALRKRAMFN